MLTLNGCDSLNLQMLCSYFGFGRRDIMHAKARNCNRIVNVFQHFMQNSLTKATGGVRTVSRWGLGIAWP